VASAFTTATRVTVIAAQTEAVPTVPQDDHRLVRVPVTPTGTPEPAPAGAGSLFCHVQVIDSYLAWQYSSGMDADFLANWTTQMRKGLLELCVLATLKGTRMYGYDIVKRLSAVDGLVMGEGTIYPILSRFKKEGLVDTTLAESPEGPARKYYQLTARGRLLLTRMLNAWAEVRDGIEAVTGAETKS
jgi:PadR family transcriptional regulator PadR